MNNISFELKSVLNTMIEMDTFIQTIPEENFDALLFPELDQSGPQKLDEVA